MRHPLFVITLTFFNNTNFKGIKSVKSFQLAHEDFVWVGLEHTPQSYNFLRQQQTIQYIFPSTEEYFELVVTRWKLIGNLGKIKEMAVELFGGKI